MMKRLISTFVVVMTIVYASNIAQAEYVTTYNPSSPTIDGVLGANEWGTAYAATMDRADGGGQHDVGLYFQHDGTSLFIGVDSQWGTGWDVVWDCFIDGDHNGTLNGNLSQPYVDVNICKESPTGYSGYTAYRSLPSVGQDVRVGFGSGAACASSGSTNVFYEFSIPLADLNASTGDSVGFFISHGYDGVSSHLYELSSAGSRNTPAEWATLRLATPPSPRVISALGEWFDTDKKHLPGVGGSWGTNHYNDENVDGKYTPGEDYAESEQPEWAHPSASSDKSCWMATANNMIRNYGGDDHYQDWAFDTGILHDSETLTFANGGDVRWALKNAGYHYSHGAKGPLHWVSEILDGGLILTAETWISKRLSEGSAVGIGLSSIAHDVTIYSIDTDNKTITIADSDDDLRSYDPEVEGDFITVSYKTAYNKFEIELKHDKWVEVTSANAITKSLALKIVEIVNPDFGQDLATGWIAYGTGLAQTVAHHINPYNYVAELTSASPVMISQVLETPSQPFYLIFEYEFTTTSGTLEISLDSIVLGEITAPDELAGDLSTFSLYVLNPTILDLGEAIFEFKLNGEAGSQVLLDNITIQPVPEPATLSLLALCGLALLRRRRK